MNIKDRTSLGINERQNFESPASTSLQDTLESIDYKPLKPNQKPHYPEKFLEGLKKFGLGLGIGAGVFFAFALLPLTIVAVGLASKIAPPVEDNAQEQEKARNATMKAILISPGLYIAFAAINELGNISETAKNSSQKVKLLINQAVANKPEGLEEFNTSLSELTYKELMAVQSGINNQNVTNQEYTKAVNDMIAFRKKEFKIELG